MILLLFLCSLAYAEDAARITPIFKDGKYANPFPMDSARAKVPLKAMKTWFDKSKNKPKSQFPVQRADAALAFPENQSGLYITWLGHSSLLMQIDGVRLLIDPVFSNNVSPIPLIKVKRFQEKAPISAEELPFIDAVFISHDHYDHLDRETILAIENKVGYIIAPSGVKQYLLNWGVDSSKVKEFSWQEEGTIQGLSKRELRFACLPARHFSKRSLFGSNKTLWASWAFIGAEHRAFYSGDTSYGLHFKQIGRDYGPFDLTIIENGQYSIYWPDSHMMPEQGIQAHFDLRGKHMLPAHWGSFDLSIHKWNEPIERASKEAQIRGASLLTPMIGQTLSIDDNPVTQQWWKGLE